jgi:hypothetical protein
MQTHTATPARSLPTLDTLRDLLVSAPHAERGSFARIQERFLDLTEQPGFFDASRAIAAPELEALVHAAVSAIIPRAGDAPLPLALQRYGETGFFHGAFFTPEGIGTVLWFDDLGVGLVSVERLDGHGCDMRIRRPITVTKPRGREPFTMRTPRGVH